MSRPLLFAGLDVSTQGCKLVVIDLEADAVVHTDRLEYDRDLPEFGTRDGVLPASAEGVSESDPRMWIQAVEKLLDRLVPAGVPTEGIRCISVAGQQHGLVALDERGELTRGRSKLWNDFSTKEECEILTEAVGGAEGMIQEVGNTQRTGYTAGKIYHLLRHEPDLFHKTSTFFLVHNYVNWHLTGGSRGGVAVMEPGDVSGMALWHPATEEWSTLVLNAIHPDLADKLPPIRPSERFIGTLAPELAERHGLSPDCRIDAGSGDNMCGAVGTGNVREGIVTVSLGTSGTAYTVLENPYIDPEGEIAAFRDSTGRHLPLVCVSNMANGYDALRESFGLSHQDFDQMFFRMAPGSASRVIVPWYQGERTPDLPSAAPIHFGFEPNDFRPETLCRPTVEGHVLGLYEGFSRLPVDVREIRVTGGLANLPSWLQALADVFGKSVVPVRGEGAALGAAIHAAWVWCQEEGTGPALQQPGRGQSLEDLTDRFVPLAHEARRDPDPAGREANALLRRLYRTLTRRMRGLEGEDPFELRKELLSGGTADTPA